MRDNNYHLLINEITGTNSGKKTRHERYKAQGTVLGTAQTVAFGKVTCYENIKHGDDAPIVVFSQNGEDVSDEFDAWDMDTVRQLAEEM